MELLLLVSVLAQTNPITLADYSETPTLFIRGEADLRVPIGQAEELYTALQKRKIPTRFVRYPGGWSPWNTVHRYQQEMNWWKQYLQ